MYNLLMVSNDGYWKNQPHEASCSTGRYLEHTDKSIAAAFSSLNDNVIAKIMTLPTLFAYEFQCDSEVRVGKITQITRGLKEILFKYEFDENLPAISMEDIRANSNDLEINVTGLEGYRTHWAIKDVDLMEVLSKSGLMTLPIQPSQVEEVETLVADIPAARVSQAANIFIVHGRDEGPKWAVSSFLTKIGLHPIILHEQLNSGRALLTKFLENAANAEFAVVIMTPDDEGGLIGENPKHRARQNVIFELGFFVGKLGSNRVCALVSGNVERPSDFEAVVYVTYDGSAGWQLALAKELAGAGIVFDPSKMLS